MVLRMQERAVQSKLGRYLQTEFKRRGWSQRQAELKTGMSRTALNNLINDPDAMPQLETIGKIAAALEVPPWFIAEKAGLDLKISDTPEQRAQRLIDLVKIRPALAPLVDQLVGLDPEDLEMAVAYIEFLSRRRGSGQ